MNLLTALNLTVCFAGSGPVLVVLQDMAAQRRQEGLHWLGCCQIRFFDHCKLGYRNMKGVSGKAPAVLREGGKFAATWCRLLNWDKPTPTQETLLQFDLCSSLYRPTRSSCSWACSCSEALPCTPGMDAEKWGDSVHMPMTLGEQGLPLQDGICISRWGKHTAAVSCKWNGSAWLLLTLCLYTWQLHAISNALYGGKLFINWLLNLLFPKAYGVWLLIEKLLFSLLGFPPYMDSFLFILLKSFNSRLITSITWKVELCSMTTPLVLPVLFLKWLHTGCQREVPGSRASDAWKSKGGMFSECRCAYLLGNK